MSHYDIDSSGTGQDHDHRGGNAIGLLLLACGFAIGAFAGYIHVTSARRGLQQTNSASVSAGIQEKLNANLKDAAIQSEIERETTTQDNADAPTISNRDVDNGFNNNPIPFVLQQQASPTTQNDDAAKNQRLTPDQQISQMLETNTSTQDYNERYQQAYVNQFLKNAHAHGLNVRLNKNLQVTGLSVDMSNRPIVFPSTSTQSSSRK